MWIYFWPITLLALLNIVANSHIKESKLTQLPILADPIAPDWKNIELPDAWPDQLNFKRPNDLLVFLRSILKRKNRKVRLPERFIYQQILPKYLLQEFHNLPNGNYSNKITRGYTRGFDIAMLGKMTAARKHIASWLAGSSSALDVGCGGGQMTSALKNAGVNDVWGLDPSPYLLKHAANKYPNIHFIQGLAERLEFPDQRFCGITACFVFHEIPPTYTHRALTEFSRVLKPGGLLAICEPSSIQYERGWFHMLWKYGLNGVYFKQLAHFVYEPFVHAWHKQDICKLLEVHGFTIIKNEKSMPTHCILAKKS